MARARIDETVPANGFKLDVHRLQLEPDQFLQFCTDNPDKKFELTAQKELVILPPTGFDTGWKNADLITQLNIWSKTDGTGISFDSDTLFRLPNGAIRSPDAAWIDRRRADRLTAKERKGIATICPDFVVEFRSPGDRVGALKAKIVEYIENGARLGWLIDPTRRRVYLYRPGEPVEMLDNPEYVSGDPVLPGFKLRVREIF